MYFAGVDIGSTMTKVVIMNEEVLASIIGPTGAEHRRLAYRVMEQALERASLSLNEISYTVATGYGRINVPFADKQITEITCHAKGVSNLFPTARTIIDIGGQDAKGIRILAGGKVVSFVMNDKCAAGTGRFIEVIADTLGFGIDEIGDLSLKSRSSAAISDTCTVFAEQEVVSRLADGALIEDILAGIHQAVARRAYRLAERLKIEREVVMTGGVAKNTGVVKSIEDCLGFHVLVPQEPLLTGAIGAALLGRELTLKSLERGEPVKTGARRLEEATFFR